MSTPRDEKLKYNLVVQMAIVIDNPTAEEIYEALKQVPAVEITRLREMLNQPAPETAGEESAAWYQASQVSAARFFDEEDGQ